MAQARKLERDNTRVGASTAEVRKVKKPENMLNHKETKQFKEDGDKVEKTKEVKKEKMSRVQMVEQFQVDIAKVAEANPKLAVKAQKYYEAFFQVASSKDFMTMVQSVNAEEGTILLKSGFNLPILPEEDVIDFMDLFVSITDGVKSPTHNIVKYSLDNPDFDSNILLFTYAMFELVGSGRKTPNIDWDSVESGAEFDLEAEGLYSKMYLLISDYLEAGTEDSEAAQMLKGALMTLAPNAFEAFSPLFNRESFKKQGIVISSPTEGKDAVITPVISEIISYMMFDTFGDYAAIEEEQEDEEEETVPEKKPMTSQKDTQKPKAVVEEETEEDEEDEEEEEETPFDSDEDDIEIDEEDESDEEWDEEDEEDEEDEY